jgi:hypothetical protein
LNTRELKIKRDRSLRRGGAVDQVKEIYQVYAGKHSKKITFKRLFVCSLECTRLHHFASKFSKFSGANSPFQGA